MDVPAPERPKTSARRKKARKQARAEDVRYVVQIKDWDWDFSFGLFPIKGSEDPFYDFHNVIVRGTLLRPPSWVKTDKVELTFRPERYLNEGEREAHRANGLECCSSTARNCGPALSFPPMRFRPSCR
jgi:hypothetical protein